jgi:penicillin-binding protein 1A
MRFIYKFFQLVLGAFFALLTLGAVGLFALYSHYAPQLPDEAELRKIDIQVPLRIYTRDGELLAEYGERRSRPVTLAEVPERLKLAFLDIEDARFYQHQGVDFKGVARALRSAVSTGSTTQGASTITMQLAKNEFLDADKTFERKFKQTLLAIKMEQSLGKDEILELYLNKVYLGNRAYGIASAAETYYGKTLGELTLAQSAMIAGLPKAPSRYNPIANPERAMIRRNYILKRMLELGHISQLDYQAALNEPNTAEKHKTEIDAEAPYLAEMVRADIVKRFGEASAYTQGYHVYTTLDSAKQAEAAESLRKALTSYDHRHGYRGPEDKVELGDLKNEDEMRDKLSTYPVFGDLHPALVLNADSNSAELLVGETRVALDFNAVKWAREFKTEDRRGASPKRVSDVLKPGYIVRLRQTDKEKDTWVLSQVPTVGGALVSIDPSDGAVRAVMGGFDFYHSKFNRATQAVRQPGSSFKPIVYAAALAKGFTPASVVNDAPIDIPGSNWKPENFGGRYIGPTTLREALAKSRNLVSIRLLRSIGINYTVDFATRFGFPKENLPPNLTLALGTAMTTPMEMATAYAAFANGGYKIDAYFITRIEDRNHKLLFEETSPRICPGELETCVLKKQDEKQLTGDEGKDGKDASDKTADKKPEPDQPDKPIWETAAVERPKIGEDGVYPAAKRILDSRTHYQIVSMMQGVTQFGTAARAGRSLNRKDIAGKTGTTNDQKDAWFCGFTPDVVTIAWVGFDDMAKLGEGETATNVALPMWIDFMHRVLKGEPSKEWEKPVDLKEADLGGETGRKFANGNDGESYSEGGGFQYKSERDLAPRRNAQQQAPAPQRTPERVEIPEQLF